MHIARVIPQAEVTEGQFLDRAGLPAGINDVADAELVFQEEEESREVILDQTLRSESDGNTDDPGGSQDRGDRNAQLPEDEHGPQQSDCDCQHIAYDARKRADSLSVLGGFLAGDEKLSQLRDDAVDRSERKQGEYGDQENTPARSDMTGKPGFHGFEQLGHQKASSQRIESRIAELIRPTML